MKTSLFAALLFSIASNIHGQTAVYPVTTNQSGSAPVQDTPYAIVNRDANSRVWERTTYERDPGGAVFPHVHRYTEMATGLNYQKDGQWADSKEEIDLLPTGGAAATQGQHQAYFPSDVYNGEIQMVAPDGQVLRSRPVGLSYDDGTNTVLIAELKDSVGELVGSNQVLYPDAFTAFKADLLYSYTKYGFEQDIVLRESPPTPQAYGLNPATARLQILTEFFSPPQPRMIQSALPPQAGLSLPDQTLDFGSTEMIRGRAFLLGADATDESVLVSKQWLVLDDRQFLVEEVPVDAIVNGLAALPSAAMNSNSRKASRLASRHLVLPPQRLVQNNTSDTVMLAKAEMPKAGLVLDYQTVIGSLTNFTFQGDMTYYLTNYVSFYGTNTFEGGTVLKYSTNGFLSSYGSLICKTGPYHPACFTSKDDNSIGETISGSTGSPTTGSAYLNDEYGGNTLRYVRFAYANPAIQADNEQIWDSQFVHCHDALLVWHNVSLYNVLFGHCNYAIAPIYGGTIVGENLTTDSNLMDGDTTTLCLTNCILADDVSAGTVDASHCVSSFNLYISGIDYLSGPFFQTAGAASYYLTNGSACHSYGATNIDGTLLSELRQKTTYPPIIYSNVTISTNLVLGPQAPRDTNASPDLGYHYDPLDHCFGGVVASSNIGFTAGTAVGWFELPGSGGPGFGIRLAGAGSAAFNGIVNAPCMFARYSVVQEGGNGLWGDKGWLAGVTSAQSNPSAVNATARFTHFAELVADPNDFAEYYEPLYLNANHCEFWSGISEGYWMHQCFTNCLFDRVDIGIHGNYASLLAMRNCTMHGGQLYSQHSGGTWQVWIENCAFDGSTNFMDDNSGGNTNITYCDFNGFLNGAQRLVVLGAHDQVTNNFTWQTGPLGNWYQPSSSFLVNTGSVTADLIGLYHFTTQTNEVKETDSIVDIGYHYVALDANGNPVDTDGDGVPDYLEDANGNGIVDPGEDSWLKADLGIWISRPEGLVSTP